MNEEKEIELAPTDETEAREREIKLLINIVEPDPEYQPLFVSDEASLFDICGHEETKIRNRLEFYFGAKFPSKLSTPLWKIVDILRIEFPGWPEDFEKSHH